MASQLDSTSHHDEASCSSGPRMAHPPMPNTQQTQPIDVLEFAYAALELNEDEIGDHEFDQNMNINIMLVGKLITDKLVKFAFMRDTLAAVWRPGRGVAVKDLGNNTFMFQFFHEIDLKHILEDGPWSFEKSLLVL